MRLFVGIPIAEKVKKNIMAFQKELFESGADLKLVSTQNLHFTLKFLGEVSSHDVEKIKSKLEVIKMKKTIVELSGVGVFPNEKLVRVVWVGIKENKKFVSLVKNVQESLKDVKKEDYSQVVVHLTVARVRSSLNFGKLLGAVKQFQGNSFGSFVVDRFVLYESVLTGKESVYYVIKEFRTTDL